MSEGHFDAYEHFNYDQDKYVNVGHGGKNRSKREVTENTNRNDAGGHSRKLVTKMQNTECNKRPEAGVRRNSSSSS